MSQLRRWLRSRAPEPETDDRRFVADGVVLCVRLVTGCPDPLIRDIDAVLAGYPPTTDRPRAWFAVRPRGDAFEVTGSAPAEASVVHDRHLVVHQLEEWISDASLDLAAPAIVRIHAAAVALDGHTTLVLGASKSGKSTLALEAVSRGAEYLSDERVSIIPSAGGVLTRGLGRPIHLRSSPEAIAARHPASDGLLIDDTFRTLFPRIGMEAIGGRVRFDEIAPTRLLILTDDEVVRTATGAVSPGWAALQLVAASMDAARRGSVALDVLGDVALTCAIEARPTRTLRSLVEPAFDSPPRGGRARRLVPTSGDEGVLAVTTRCSTVALDDEIVLWITGSPPRLALLRGERAAWWRALIEGESTSAPHSETCEELIVLGALAERQPT